MIDELRELYQEVILDHGKHPRNFRRPEDANHQAKGHNPLCGDRVTVFLQVDGAGVIRDVAFQGRGCAISTASASLMTEVLRGKTEAEAHRLFEAFRHMVMVDGEMPAVAGLEDEAERLQVLAGVRQYPVRVKCATLAWHTMEAALADSEKVTTE